MRATQEPLPHTATQEQLLRTATQTLLAPYELAAPQLDQVFGLITSPRRSSTRCSG